MAQDTWDHIVVGGGVIGLAMARELVSRGHVRVLVIEKESMLGAHASGRNSGVLHAGLYYPPESAKARLCVEGAAALRGYLEEKGLPHAKVGKLIVPYGERGEDRLRALDERARANGVRVETVDVAAAREIEPLARVEGRALWSPDTWTFEPVSVLRQLARDAQDAGVELRLGEKVLAVDPKRKAVTLESGTIGYGWLINAAGMQADRIAHACGVGLDYELVPFRGAYRTWTGETAAQVRGLIYPVPDPDLPFLGVHVTRTVGGRVKVGPTAFPAFGREAYETWLDREQPGESVRLVGTHARVAMRSAIVRRHAWAELRQLSRQGTARAAAKLVRGMMAEDLSGISSVGLRAQLVNRRAGELVQDFVVETGASSTHVLNAVSPAFSSALAFAKAVMDSIESGSGGALGRVP